MKKILCFLFVLIAISQVNANGNGNDPDSPVGMSVIKKGSVVRLFYRGEQTGKVKVTIYNDQGEAVYRETLQNTEQFMRPYNFSSLPEGDYTIELLDAQGKRFQRVTHSRAEEKRVAHLQRLNNREHKYLLAVPNIGRDDLTVRIYDENSQLLYEKTEIIQGHFAKVYNLNEVGGDHTFLIVDSQGKMNRLSKPVR